MKKGVSMNRRLETKTRKSWKKKKPGDHWDLLGYKTPGHETEAGVLALVGRASKTPGRVTCCKGVHGGSYCSLGVRICPRWRGPRVSMMMLLRLWLWLWLLLLLVMVMCRGWRVGCGLTPGRRKGPDECCCWARGGHKEEEEEVGPGSTQPGMGEKAGCTWVAD